MKKSVFISASILMFFFGLTLSETFGRIDLAWTKKVPYRYEFSMAKFSPNGKKIATGLIGDEYDSTTKAKVVIYDVSSGDSLMELLGHNGWGIWAMTWLNDSTLASGDDNNHYGKKRTLRIWNVNTGENLHTFFDSDTLYPWHDHVNKLVNLPGKNKLYVELFTDRRERINNYPPYEYIYWSDTVLVINTSTYEIIKPLSFSDSNSYHNIGIVSGAPDGSWYYISENGYSQLRNPDNDSLIFKSDSTNLWGFSQISLNGKYGINHISNAVDIYNLENRSFVNFLKFDSINNIDNCLISPDSRYVAVTGYYEKEDYWRTRFGYAEIENQSNQFFQDSISSELSFEASNDSLYVLCQDKYNLRIYTAPWSPKNTKVEDKNETRDYLIISPNPAEDYIEISVGSRHAFTNTDIRIFNVFGEILKNLSPSLSEGEGVRIDLTGLPSGVYFVRVGGKVGKFVKL